MKKTQYSPPATLRVAMRAGNTPPLHHSSSPITIISGGQTGADRATLDWALSHGVPCGGWCPRGRMVPIPVFRRLSSSALPIPN
jgi:Circularly permutated YpsA SLOG family